MAANSIARQQISENPNKKPGKNPPEKYHIISDALIKKHRKKTQNRQRNGIIDDVFPARMKQRTEQNPSQSQFVSRHNSIAVEFPDAEIL